MGSIRHWRFLLLEHDPIGKPVSKARVLPQVPAGRKISALAITEPGGGSDVANLRTKRLVEPTSGSIRLNGQDIAPLSKSELRPHRRGVACEPRGPHPRRYQSVAARPPPPVGLIKLAPEYMAGVCGAGR